MLSLVRLKGEGLLGNLCAKVNVTTECYSSKGDWRKVKKLLKILSKIEKKILVTRTKELGPKR